MLMEVAPAGMVTTVLYPAGEEREGERESVREGGERESECMREREGKRECEGGRVKGRVSA